MMLITCHSCFLASNSSSSSSDDIPGPPPFILMCGCVLILFLVAERNFLNTAYTWHVHSAVYLILHKTTHVAYTPCPKNSATKPIAVTSSNLNGVPKFFYHRKEKEISNKTHVLFLKYLKYVFAYCFSIIRLSCVNVQLKAGLPHWNS